MFSTNGDLYCIYLTSGWKPYDYLLCLGLYFVHWSLLITLPLLLVSVIGILTYKRIRGSK